MPLGDRFARVKQDDARRSRLWQAQNDLYFLATEILHYDLLREDFHRPLCDWWHEHEDWQCVLLMAARKHYKSTVFVIADAVQRILRDPDCTQMVIHAVEKEAEAIVQEIGHHFVANEDLRKLRPDIMPSKTNKKFLKQSEFTITRGRLRFDRQPTVAAKGIFSEITGAHVSGCIHLDDIVSKSIVDDSGGIEKVKQTYQNTIIPVANPGCKIRVTGTHWDQDDPYVEWRKNPLWACMVRAALETDGVPDYKGEPVLMTREQIEFERAEMKGNFSFQMMNDPSPPSEVIWDRAKCEHRCTKKYAEGPGFVVVLSDPAPAKIGAFIDEKKRGDGDKDEWANAVVKFRAKGQREEIILLDGSASKEWAPEAGFREICRLKRLHHTGNVAVEKTGQAMAFYMDDLDQMSRKENVRHFPIDLTMTYKGKNIQFASLAERAAQGEFLICESCPEEFVDGFLAQARGWRALPSGRNNLKHDDRANVVSFATDPVFTQYAPRAVTAFDHMLAEEEAAMEAHEAARTRYQAW